MSGLFSLLDAIISIYDTIFRTIYYAILDVASGNEELVILLLENGALIGLYMGLIDKKLTTPNSKWVCRVLLGMFVMYSLYSGIAY